MSTNLIPSRFLFRFAVPLEHCPLKGGKELQLSSQHRLENLADLDVENSFAEVRAGWNEVGMAFSVNVSCKTQPVWCRDSRIEESDGLQLWIDTRATHNIHRASRFCHRFAFLPAGGGRGFKEPVADQLLINRARENAQPVRPKQLLVNSEVRDDGYRLDVILPTEVLTGYDPEEHPQLGFTYAIYDRELGLQTFSVGSGFPYTEDPSTWATLELVR